MSKFSVEEKRIGRIERQRDAQHNKSKKILSQKLITKNSIEDFDWLFHKEHTKLIKNNNKKLLIIETPFHLAHSDVPFDQVIYFKNIVKTFEHLLPDIKNGKIKIIYLFADAWGTVNNNESHKSYSGALLALDLYDVLYQANKKAGILEHSVFCTGTSLKGVLQKEDWPIVYYNEPFNRYFTIGEDLRVSSRIFKKHFLWLNRRTRDHKLYALHQAYKHKIFDNSLYTFHDFENETNEVYELKLKKYTQDIDLDFLNYKTLPDVLDNNYDLKYDNQHRETLLNLKKHANKCYAEIVSEYMGSDDKVFLTEKISRSIVMGKPFIVIGDRGMLAELQTLGFRTFDDFWDESYDNLPTVKERIDAVMLILKDIQENLLHLKGYQDHMLEILQHNKKHYYGSYKQSQLKYFREMIK